VAYGVRVAAEACISARMRKFIKTNALLKFASIDARSNHLKEILLLLLLFYLRNVDRM
jgi:hypothetical protein